MPRLPLSAKCWAMELSNTRQSDPIIADATPSWLDLGIASQISLRRFPFNSNLKNYTIRKLTIKLYDDYKPCFIYHGIHGIEYYYYKVFSRGTPN